jgi:hypothetical protein
MGSTMVCNPDYRPNWSLPSRHFKIIHFPCVEYACAWSSGFSGCHRYVRLYISLVLNMLVHDLQASLDATATRHTSALVSQLSAAKSVVGQKKHWGDTIFLQLGWFIAYLTIDALKFSLLFQAPYAMSWMLLMAKLARKQSVYLGSYQDLHCSFS